MSRRRETRRSCLSFQAMLAASLCAQVKSCRARCGKTTRRANQQNPSSVRCENIPLSPSGKSVILIGASHPMRGACARHGRAVRCGGRGAGARRAQAARVRRSRVVLTPRCWRQLGGKCPAGDGGKRAVHRGEHEVSRKATAQGRPGCSACTCMLVCAFLVRNCTRDRGCSVHPVFPAPSIFEGANEVANLGRRRREIAKLYPRHCERSEAIHVYTCGAMDCFAVLAMTARAATYRCRCAR